MRRGALVLAMLLGCSAESEVSIEILRAGTLDPLEPGDTLEVSLRPQGVYGAVVDLHVRGIDVDAVPMFGVCVHDEQGILADQRYLGTSTGVSQGDGSFVMAGLYVVFHEGITVDRVDGAPGRLVADIESTPPAEGGVDVVMQLVDE